MLNRFSFLRWWSITLALKTEWTRPCFIDLWPSGITDWTRQTKDSHIFLCIESPTNIVLFPWIFLSAMFGSNLNFIVKNLSIVEINSVFHLHGNFNVIFELTWQPWQDAVIRSPFPVKIIWIISSILSTRILSVNIWTSCMCVEWLNRSIEHPFSIIEAAFLGIKHKPIICWIV